MTAPTSALARGDARRNRTVVDKAGQVRQAFAIEGSRVEALVLEKAGQHIVDPAGCRFWIAPCLVRLLNHL
jgi:hypothetical protein